MTLAILCSGQGLQHSRMFSLTGNAPAAQPVFAHAAKLLGDCDPRDLVQAEPAEVLHRNRIAQIICVSQALAAAAVARIAVNVAAHTARLASASLRFHAALERTPAIGKMRTGVRLFSGVDGTAVLDLASGKNKLAEQICRTVDWAACLEGCLEAGASAFLELGPGAALSKMCAHAYPDIPSRHLEDFRTIEGAASWLSYHQACD
jgi:malonyl CoA-acyl carrier protein transacylase